MTQSMLYKQLQWRFCSKKEHFQSQTNARIQIKYSIWTLISNSSADYFPFQLHSISLNIYLKIEKPKTEILPGNLEERRRKSGQKRTIHSILSTVPTRRVSPMWLCFLPGILTVQRLLELCTGILHVGNMVVSFPSSSYLQGTFRMQIRRCSFHFLRITLNSIKTVKEINGGYCFEHQ